MKNIKSTIKRILDEKTGIVTPVYTRSAAKAEYISFDIFDTLIVRDTDKPTDLFTLMEKQLCQKGFSKKRISAELAARSQKKNGEVTIHDIYASFEGISPEMAECYCRAELQAELFVCRPNQNIMPFYQKCICQKKVILTSDMYLPSDMMRKILDKCGITGYKKLYISCEAGTSKHNSGLYRYVLSDLGITADKLLHIGNDWKADYYCAKKAGISAQKLRTGITDCHSE